MKFDFELEPHDAPTDEAGFEVVTHAKWEGKTFSLGWGEGYKGMETSRVALFQTPGEPLLRAVSAVNFPDSCVSSERAVSVREGGGALREAFVEVAQCNGWARLLFLREDGELRRQGERALFCVFLTGCGWGQWRRLRQTQSGRTVAHRAASFWWTPGDEALLWSGSARDVWNELRAQLDAPDSPFAFARRFADTPANERSALLWRTKGGTRSEMEAVLRNLFLSQFKWWQTPRHITWCLDLKNRSEMCEPLDDGPKPRRTPSFGKSLDRVWNWFSPSVDAETLARHLELKWLYEAGDHSIVIEVCDPTMHEQMEAALEWREWLERSGA
jgi:hypothetical protein